MKEKPITPYARLLHSVRKYAQSVKYAAKKTMWVYPPQRLNEGWSLHSLCERVKAADQLGWDVCLVATDDGLRVEYRQRPDTPWDWA